MEKTEEQERRTMTFKMSTWKFLAQYKLDHGFDTFDDVIKHMRKRLEKKKC